MIARRVLAQAAALVALAAAAAACVSMPDSGPVNQADVVRVEDNTQQITNEVLGPVPGEGPSEIVQGFYAAMLAYPRTSDTARLFLTPRAAEEWDPDDRLYVYDAIDFVPVSIARQGVSEIQVDPSVIGSLDARGSWTTAAGVAADADASDRAALRSRQVDGEWRITNPRPGTYVDADFFARFYEPYSLYFFDPTRTILAADPVYLPIGDTTATALVSDLLRGPTADLQGAVYSAAPSGTKVDVGVSVSDTGVAEVPLTPEVLKLSPADRQLFAAQLTWTLRQLPQVEEVAVSVDGADLAIENLDTPFDVESFAGYDPAGLSGERRLFALAPGGLSTVMDGQVSPVLGPIREVRGGRYAAVQTSGQLAAVVEQSGTSVVVGAVPAQTESGNSTWFEGADPLIRPSWDAQEVLWVVANTPSGARIHTVVADRARLVQRAPGLAGQQIVAFAVSRDGVRLAAIVDDAGTRRLLLSTIVRDPADPTKATIDRTHEIANATIRLTGYRDLAWVSPTALAVLAQEPGDDRAEPYAVAIDGSDTESAGGFLPLAPVSLAASPNSDTPIAVGTRSGQLFVQTPDLQWPAIDTQVRLRSPVYPG